MAKTKRINGQPMSHWKREAKKVVLDSLVRAAINFGWGRQRPEQSIIHKIAADRLMELANGEDPGLVKELLEERDRCLAGLARVLGILPGESIEQEHLNGKR
jgi:ribosomal protein L11